MESLGDLTEPDLPLHSFDVLVSIDTLCFSKNYGETIRRWRALVREGGQMAIFFSHGANPENPRETFRRAALPPDQTPLGVALKQCGLCFQTEDGTWQDEALAHRKQEILAKLKTEFEAEGNQFLYEDRVGEALGVAEAVAIGMHARYLYRVLV